MKSIILSSVCLSILLHNHQNIANPTDPLSKQQNIIPTPTPQPCISRDTIAVAFVLTTLAGLKMWADFQSKPIMPL